MSISSNYSNSTLEKQFLTVRSFPEGKRNCYTLRSSLGKGYQVLIRAGFFYGNYDSKDQPPTFELQLGDNIWDTVSFESLSSLVRIELIHVPANDYINVCLLNTGLGTPFISALELRSFSYATIYDHTFGSLKLYRRLDLGSAATQPIRYGDDIYDRIWTPFNLNGTTTISTTSTFGVDDDFFQIPSIVMATANTPQVGKNMDFSWVSPNISERYYYYLHFAEVESLPGRVCRGMVLYLDGEVTLSYFSPFYLASTTFEITSPLFNRSDYDLLFTSSQNCTLPPIINAIEVFTLKNFSSLQTNDNDVAAIWRIKNFYGLGRNWQGDPCVPESFPWSGLDCSYDSFNSSRITSLNLSSSGLTGVIALSFSNLTMLEMLCLIF